MQGPEHMQHSQFDYHLIPYLQPRRHPRSAIQPNHTSIEHDILHRSPRQLRKLDRRARSLRKLHRTLKALAHIVGRCARHGRLEHARRNRYDADAEARQVSRHGQRHAGHGAFRGGIGGLTHLPVEGGGRRDHDDDAVLGVTFGSEHGGRGGEVWEELANQVEFPAEVDGEHKVEGFEGEGPFLSVEDLDSRFL